MQRAEHHHSRRTGKLNKYKQLEERVITNVARQHFDFRRVLCSQSQQRPQPDTNQSTIGS